MQFHWPNIFACSVAKSCWVFTIPRTVAGQAPLSMEFPRQEYWSGLPFPTPEDLPDPEIKPKSPALQGILTVHNINYMFLCSELKTVIIWLQLTFVSRHSVCFCFLIGNLCPGSTTLTPILWIFNKLGYPLVFAYAISSACKSLGIPTHTPFALWKYTHSSRPCSSVTFSMILTCPWW